MKFLIAILLFGSTAFAGPLADEVHSVQSAKAHASYEKMVQSDLSQHLSLLQRKCHKSLRLNGNQEMDIEETRCVIAHDDICYRKAYYVRFTDGSIGLVAWSPPYFQNPLRAECNLNR